MKKIPIIGQACGWFGFAFLERNWSKDKAGFERQLEEMARDCQVEGEGGKLDFLLFPEGTIVTVSSRNYLVWSPLSDTDFESIGKHSRDLFEIRRES